MSKVLIEWTQGIQDLINATSVTTKSTLEDLLYQHGYLGKTYIENARSSALGSLTEHIKQNELDFGSRANELVNHTRDMSKKFSGIDNLLTQNHSKLFADDKTARTYSANTLNEHEAAQDPHPRYVLKTKVGTDIPPLHPYDVDESKLVIPYSYLKSDIIRLNSLTAINNYRINQGANLGADKLFIAMNTGYAYHYSATNNTLKGLSVETEGPITESLSSSLNAGGNKHVLSLFSGKQPASSALTNFSKANIQDTGLIYQDSAGNFSVAPLDNSAGSLSILVSEDLISVGLKYGETTRDTASTPFPGVLPTISRADHKHALIAHSHSWEQITGAADGVLNTELTSLDTDTVGLVTNNTTLIQALGYIQNSLGSLNTLSLGLWKQAKKLSEHASDLNTRFSDIRAFVDPKPDPNRVLVVNEGGIITSSPLISYGELLCIKDATSNIYDQYSEKHSKVKDMYASAPYTNCPSVCSFITLTGRAAPEPGKWVGGLDRNGDLWYTKHEMPVLSNLCNAERNVLYRVGSTHSGTSFYIGFWYQHLDDSVTTNWFSPYVQTCSSRHVEYIHDGTISFMVDSNGDVFFYYEGGSHS